MGGRGGRWVGLELYTCMCIFRGEGALRRHICEKVLPSFGYANQVRRGGDTQESCSYLCWLGDCCLCAALLCLACFARYPHGHVLFSLPCEVTLGAETLPQAQRWLGGSPKCSVGAPHSPGCASKQTCCCVGPPASPSFQAKRFTKSLSWCFTPMWIKTLCKTGNYLLDDGNSCLVWRHIWHRVTSIFPWVCKWSFQPRSERCMVLVLAALCVLPRAEWQILPLSTTDFRNEFYCPPQ